MVALTFALIASLLTSPMEPAERPRVLRPMPDNTVEQLDLLAWRQQPRVVEPHAALIVQIQKASGRTRDALLAKLVSEGRWERRLATLAHGWRCSTVAHQELVQAGYVGLLEAVRRFDPSRIGWATYATLWCRKEMERLARRQGHIVIETEYERRAKGRERRPIGWAQLRT